MAADPEHDKAGKKNSPLLWLIFDNSCFSQLCSRYAWRCGLLALPMLRVENPPSRCQIPTTLLSVCTLPAYLGVHSLRGELKRISSKSASSLVLRDKLGSSVHLMFFPTLQYLGCSPLRVPGSQGQHGGWGSLSWRPQQHF